MHTRTEVLGGDRERERERQRERERERERADSSCFNACWPRQLSWAGLSPGSAKSHCPKEKA